jgi:hypothetical protein
MFTSPLLTLENPRSEAMSAIGKLAEAPQRPRREAVVAAKPPLTTASFPKAVTDASRSLAAGSVSTGVPYSVLAGARVPRLRDWRCADRGNSAFVSIPQ